MLGSGPDATGVGEVKSTQNPRLFMLDLKTLALDISFGTGGILELTGEADSFVGDIISADAVNLGTGRFYTENDTVDVTQRYPFGVKESVDTSGAVSYGSMDSSKIVDVTDAIVLEKTGALTGVTLSPVLGGGGTVSDLEARMMLYSNASKYQSGWKKDLGTGERVIGQPALYGSVVTQTSYKPNLQPCSFIGESYLYASRYTTGTAWCNPSLTPSLHSGEGNGDGTVSAYVQKADTSFLKIELVNLEGINSGEISWREM